MQRRQEGVPFAPKCDTVIETLSNPEKVLSKLAAKIEVQEKGEFVIQTAKV